eukprot:s126_g37.t1
MGERLDALGARVTANADDARDALNVVDDATDAIRYGLTECMEEEAPTEVEKVAPTTGMSDVVHVVGNNQNVALATELWDDAAQIQETFITMLDGSAGANPRR